MGPECNGNLIEFKFPIWTILLLFVSPSVVYFYSVYLFFQTYNLLSNARKKVKVYNNSTAMYRSFYNIHNILKYKNNLKSFSLFHHFVQLSWCFTDVTYSSHSNLSGCCLLSCFIFCPNPEVNPYQWSLPLRWFFMTWDLIVGSVVFQLLRLNIM